MANDTSLTIPVRQKLVDKNNELLEKYMPMLSKNIEAFSSILSDSEKEQLKSRKKEDEANEEQLSALKKIADFDNKIANSVKEKQMSNVLKKFRDADGKIKYKYLDYMSTHLDKFSNLLSLEDKERITAYKAEKEYQEAQKSWQTKFMKLQMMAYNPKFQKIKDTMTVLWGKFLKPFIKGMGQFFKSIASRTSGLLGLLIGLYFLLKTGLLQKLIPIVADLIVTLIDGIIKYLPEIVKFLLDLFFNDLPKLADKVFQAVLDAFGVAEDSPLRKLAKWLADALPYIILIGAVLKGLSAAGFLMPLLTFIVDVAIPGIISGITALIPLLGSLLAAIWPLLVIAAIVVGLVLLYKYAEKINKWIDGLYDKFKKLSTKGKILIGILAWILAPLTAIILALVGLVKLFNWFKTSKDRVGDIKKAFQKIKDMFFDFIANIGSILLDKFKKLSTKGKAIAIIVGLLLLPITLIVAQLLVIFKIITWFKKNQIISKTLKKIVSVIKDLAKIVNSIVSFIKELWKYANDFISGEITGKQLLESVIDLVMSTIKSIGTVLNNKVAEIFGVDLIKTFKKVTNWFAGMIDALFFNIAKSKIAQKVFGMSDYGAKTSQEYSARSSIASAGEDSAVLQQYQTILNTKDKKQREAAVAGLSDDQKVMLNYFKSNEDLLKQLIKSGGDKDKIASSIESNAKITQATSYFDKARNDSTDYKG